MVGKKVERRVVLLAGRWVGEWAAQMGFWWAGKTAGELVSWLAC